MKVSKALFALAVLFTLTFNTSCEKEDISERETLSITNEQAIDGNDVEEEDM